MANYEESDEEMFEGILLETYNTLQLGIDLGTPVRAFYGKGNYINEVQIELRI